MKLHPVLTIAGSDSSGGAGIQADLKTMTMLGCFGMSVITALTAQNTVGVMGIHPVPAEFVRAQLTAVCEDIRPDAVKIGMVYDVPQIETILKTLRELELSPVVVDPVMVSTSGDPLLREKAQTALEMDLFPLAALVTPNLPEAQVLLDRTITSHTEMETAAKTLAARYQTAVLLKGGHSVGDCNDLLVTSSGACTWFPGTKVDVNNTHGTGCTLSSAIASCLAKGESLEKSVEHAKTYVTNAIGAGLVLGKGCGPIAHNYRIIDTTSEEV